LVIAAAIGARALISDRAEPEPEPDTARALSPPVVASQADTPQSPTPEVPVAETPTVEESTEDTAPAPEPQPSEADQPADSVEQPIVQPQDEAETETTDRPLSEPAPPPPTGTLSVLVMPWAEIESIENVETGERLPGNTTTPARLELPAGRYRLHLIHPYTSGSLDVDAVVRADRTEVIQRTLPGFDAAGLAREIISAEAARGAIK
jgi:hypothetical protein